MSPISRASRRSATASRSLSRAVTLRRARWKDPRLAAGAAMIGASVALGAWAVSTAANTEPIYALAQDVAPGDDLTAAGVLTIVESNPGTGSYVHVGELPEGAVATQSLSAGDLLPTSSIAGGQDLGLRSVVLSVSSALPERAGTGDEVDLWALPAASTAVGGESGSAVVVAQGLVIAHVGESGSALLGGTTTSVEVLVPEDLVGDVLTALGEGSALVLVPTGQSA